MGVKQLKELSFEKIEQAAKQQNPAAKIWGQVIPQPVVENRTPEFSVIICSVNDDKFNNVSQCYQIALAGEDYEIVRISDATGLAEGYNRGAAQARGKILIFSHDDAAPMRPVGARIRAHLRSVDIVAGAGADRLDGPAWFTAGPPHVFGQVLNRVPNTNQMMLTVYGVPKALVPNICVFDGFWFACKRSVLAKLKFDETVCPGFHMYDVDFSFRAYRLDIPIGVACDLSLCHASSGGYGDPKWKPLADRWMELYAPHLEQHKPRTWQFAGVNGTDPNDLMDVMDQFVERTR